MPLPTTEGYIRCNYCCMAMPIKRSQRRRHVYEDLRPYICLEIDCLTPEKGYIRSSEWIDHTTQAHWKMWICPYSCQKNFLSIDDFKEHVTQNHPQAPSGSGLGLLTELSERSRSWEEGIYCPPCSEILGTPKEYQRHVGYHQIALALFALPPSYRGFETIEEVEEIESSDASEESENSVIDDATEDPFSNQSLETILYDNLARHRDGPEKDFLTL
ncbi:uncharacterized protein F4822DRAFT_90881 [Hypoxylon trugodes]|uniref:uncharacterized protein n=1 Tax=Hypoxylon trugodes TaxID=326681 RepID=UPI002195168E|nr:uncharacterized protein F4822DRAFT_90881 [Hypoxylon trugodes]KAI1383042.1 hypothetical protein F4822DRAFT_90881 [Hypoxylon trugodes]